MKLIKWEFEGLVVPMIDVEGHLYCTSKAICSALGVSKNHLEVTYHRHSDEVGNPLDPQNVSLREFLVKNKSELEIKRVRGDLSLWSEKQMLTFSCHLKSDKCISFRSSMIDLVIANAKKGVVSREEYEQLEARQAFTEHQLGILLQERDAMQAPMDQIASGAGRLLRAHRDVKPFRTNKGPTTL